MFNVPQSKINEFQKLYKTHRIQISACDVFFQNIRMLSLHANQMTFTRDMFKEYYKTFTWDIESKTSPIDAFIPCDAPTDTPDVIEPEDLVKQKLFIVNRDIPEYQRIKNRITMDELKKTLNETHPVIMALTNGTVTYDDIIDEIFVHWSVFKYLDYITTIRIQIFSNMKPLIEYVVQNIDEFTIKRYLRKTKVDEDKVNKHQDMMFFGPSYSKICDFYNEDNENPEETGIPKFDLDDLINRLMSNIDVKGDQMIILGIYLVADFAVSDFKTHAEKSESMDYVRDVLAHV